MQVVIVAEADPASIPLEDREDLHVKPDPDAMTNGHTNGLEIKVHLPLLPVRCSHPLRITCQAYLSSSACALLLAGKATFNNVNKQKHALLDDVVQRLWLRLRLTLLPLLFDIKLNLITTGLSYSSCGHKSACCFQNTYGRCCHRAQS